jgi:hypothetical protein
MASLVLAMDRTNWELGEADQNLLAISNPRA